MVKKKTANVGLLPDELVTQVLVRLPVKTLLVCKSVSKPWLSLISNPNFIKSHLHYVINNNNNNPMLLDILAPVDTVPEEPPFNLGTLEHPDMQYIEELETFLGINGHEFASRHICYDPVVLPSVFRGFGVVGKSACNGIICLIDGCRNVFYLWNPSIRMCKEVCVPEVCLSRSSRVEIGFCYDSGLNDYKVFRTLYEINLDKVTFKMQVYSASADSWKEFQGPVCGKKLEKRKFEPNDFIVVSGILYFMNPDEQQLITFDLRKEVFRPIPFPSFVQKKWSDVLDFKGYVAMVFESVSGVDIWTMEDDVSGQVSSWTKLFSIAPDPKLNMWLSYHLGAGQFYGKKVLKGELFMYEVLYDCEKKETKYYAVGVHNILATLKYTETLVSLDGFHQVEENAD